MLGVVLVGHRGAEEGDDGVADDLVDLPAERVDVFDQALEAGVDQLLDLLGIRSLREGGEADEVGEEDGRDPAFVGSGDEGVAAAGAEPGLCGCLRSAGRTGHALRIGGRLGAMTRLSDESVSAGLSDLPGVVPHQ